MTTKQDRSNKTPAVTLTVCINVGSRSWMFLYMFVDAGAFLVRYSHDKFPYDPYWYIVPPLVRVHCKQNMYELPFLWLVSDRCHVHHILHSQDRAFLFDDRYWTRFCRCCCYCWIEPFCLSLLKISISFLDCGSFRRGVWYRLDKLWKLQKQLFFWVMF